MLVNRYDGKTGTAAFTKNHAGIGWRRHCRMPAAPRTFVKKEYFHPVWRNRRGRPLIFFIHFLLPQGFRQSFSPKAEYPSNEAALERHRPVFRLSKQPLCQAQSVNTAPGLSYAPYAVALRALSWQLRDHDNARRATAYGAYDKPGAVFTD